ncbi:laccase domain-containing protein [Candidatus Saccharibacteria bacterium]|nr:laccase domain-containing protein [Candidatus Saccharibacteria bacterium]
MQKKSVNLVNGAVQIACSTTADGDMLPRDKTGSELEKVRSNIDNFLKQINSAITKAAWVRMDYDREDYRRYMVVGPDDAGAGLSDNHPIAVADGLATRAKNMTLFLPLADCLGAALYDPENAALMMTHLGRHATEQHGATTSVEFMTEKFGTDPKHLQIWLSPSASAENYPMWTFNNRSQRDVNIEHFISTGVRPENITGDNIDNTTDPNYFSHSNFLKGLQKTDDKFAIAARIA